MNSAKNAQFFDENADRYTRPEYPGDSFFIQFIKQSTSKPLLLDVGGGSGTFVKGVLDLCPDAKITIVDTSSNMMNQTLDPRIKTALGTLPEINLTDKYTFVSLMEVLHHVTGPSPLDSKNLAEKSLCAIRKSLDDEGYLLLSELYYEGLIWKSMPRTLIFYLLRIQNKLRLRIPINEFLQGLTVCFYSRNELEDMLKEAKFEICDTYQDHYLNTLKKHILLLRNWGRIYYICKKSA